ncbi:hypothetical protein [Nocardia paucivorans]|uniref:hypothetical protein n=1 Tax=Nocardia paucivorans TaxID=114259 RepID=UPI0002E9E7E3|nr:hypothetical protein [Nocardia paucivorans]
MDEIVLAAGEALAIAMTTEGWELIKNSVVGWWQRFRPEDAEQVGSDLDQLREDAVAAQADGDTAMQQALVSDWRLRLHRLVNGNPEVREELKRLLDDELVPALTDRDQQQVQSLVQKTSVVGSNNTTAVAGRDLNFGSSTPSA